MATNNRSSWQTPTVGVQATRQDGRSSYDKQPGLLSALIKHSLTSLTCGVVVGAYERGAGVTFTASRRAFLNGDRLVMSVLKEKPVWLHVFAISC